MSVNRHDEPIKFPIKHYYNRLLLRLVSNYSNLKSIPIKDKQVVLDYLKPSQEKTSDNGAVIILPTNRHINVRYYNYLSGASEREFRITVRTDYNIDFMLYLKKELKKGKQRIQIVNDFKKKYNITEDELKSETLYRHSTRILNRMMFKRQRINKLQAK